MTRILLIRHGESESNILGTFTGQLDAPLSELGHKQAECTARFILENYRVDAAYSSDLSRAYHTALHTAEKLGLQVQTDKRLREIYGGQWQDMLFSELSSTHPEEYALWQQDMGNSRCPGGESVAELARRVWECVMEICRENPDKTVLIATHATPIRAIQWMTTGTPLSFMKQIPWASNASVSEFAYENGRLAPVKLSQDGHLANMKTELPTSI